MNRTEGISRAALIELSFAIEKQTALHFGKAMESTTKDDKSPVTETDLLNHRLLTAELPKVAKYPVLSEEDYPPYKDRKDLGRYWLIDPIDGTKEFLKGIPDFTVLIALIDDHRPIFSVVHAPAKNTVFIAELGKGCDRFVKGEKAALKTHAGTRAPIGLVSRFHAEPEVEKFYRDHGINEFGKVGSAMKFCNLVTGEADVYYRNFGPHEWDIAAGELIVTEAGGKVVSCATGARSGKPLVYNQEETKVDPFIATAPGYVLKEST